MNKLTVFNAESAYFFFRDQAFRQSVVGSSALLCDSASLSVALRLRGLSHSRLHGPDFMDKYLRSNPTKRIAIIGGRDTAHDKIKEDYRLSNTFCSSERIHDGNIGVLIEQLAIFKPDAIFVCLGLRKQEAVSNKIWTYSKESESFDSSFTIGVGAAVDFLGGTKIRSGTFWQKAGLEWLPRLIREPRMFPRIVRSLFGCFLIGINSNALSESDLRFASNFEEIGSKN